MMIFKSKTMIKHVYLNYLLPVFTAVLVLSISFTQASANETALDGIAAVVNSDVIMVSELRAATAQVLAKQQNTADQSTLYKQVLEKLIMDKIQVQKAKAIGIKIDDAAVDTAMLTIAKQNNLDLPQLRVAMIKQGVDYKNFREGIRDRLYSDNLRKRQQGRNNIAENDVDDLIQSESFNLSKGIEYQIVDIIIPNNSNSVTQFNTNFNRAQIIRNQLLSNTNLDAASIKKLGGVKNELDWQNAETLSPVYSRTLSLMNEGELSEIIRDAKGFHILKLVKQRGGKREKTIEAQVRHILIKHENPQAKLKVTQLRNQILAGASFTELAGKHSDDNGSAINGGLLPMASTKKYVLPFANAANTLALKTLSQPIETQFGWHILEVLDRQESDTTRNRIKNQAKSLVNQQTQEEYLNNWLKSLREEAFVEYRIKL